MVKIKICGITNLGDALSCVKAGCDALGFVFYRKSRRYISPIKAKLIAEELPRGIIKIGIFVNAREKTIKRIAKVCRLDMLQFHGDESPEFCLRFKGYKVIKAFRIKDKVDLGRISRYRVSAYLFDTFSGSKMGGTGRRFDWGLLSGVKGSIFLSGGLTKENVRMAIKLISPSWVDVSSSVEVSPGKKDFRKVKQFISQVRKNQSG